MQQYFPGYPQPFGGFPPRFQPQQPEGLIRVSGIDGAKAFPLAPNGRVALFDDSRDVFYVKTTDAGGYPTLTAYAFAPLQDTPAPAPDYVTRAEFDELKEMITNGIKPVRKAKPDPAAE